MYLRHGRLASITPFLPSLIPITIYKPEQSYAITYIYIA